MKTRLILEILNKAGKTTDALLNIFIGGQTYQNLKRKALYPTFSAPSEIKTDKYLLKRIKLNFYTLLSQLKKQGFTKKGKENNKSYWVITTLGKKKLKRLRNFLSFPKQIYQKEKDNGLNIFIFDIPEKEKTKRNWLRYVLLNLGFTMLQKSVWVGDNKLPKDFLEDLNRLNLIDFIHIFRVSKPGTIKIRK